MVLTISVLFVQILLKNKVLLNLGKKYFILPLFPMFILFFISALAETKMNPFDLPEAEAELVSGYNVEYSAMGFALFFLGEYATYIINK